MKTTYGLLLIVTALMCCQAVSAQRRLVVVDYETNAPVGGANVVGNGLTTQADTLGFVTVPDTCRSLIFSHVNYESRLINLNSARLPRWKTMPSSTSASNCPRASSSWREPSLTATSSASSATSSPRNGRRVPRRIARNAYRRSSTIIDLFLHFCGTRINSHDRASIQVKIPQTLPDICSWTSHRPLIDLSM